MVATAKSRCTLCELPVTYAIVNDTGDVFCCSACREVHNLLSIDTSTQASQASSIATDTLELSLSGLWCISCGWLIQETLQRTSGVADADVCFARREAHITYDANQINSSQIQKRIRRLGYGAWPAGHKNKVDEEERHAERLLVGLVLAMHVMLISIFLYVRQIVFGAPAETEWLAHFFQIVLLIASTPLMLLFGLPILRAGVASILNHQPNMHALIAIGAFSAYGLSLRNFIMGSGHVYFDTASMLLFLVAVGRWLEIRAHKESNDELERLWQQVPAEASWLSPQGEQRVPIEQLSAGARILVRPGESFPVDGIIAEGTADVDESLLTGEHLPILRKPGDRVLAGTLSVDGSFEIVTTAVGIETAAGQIGRLLHQALWAKAPIQQTVDKLATWLVPGALLIAAGTFGYWSLVASVEQGVLNALSVLLIACPCALGLATPLTLWHSVGRAATEGVILRNARVLEEFAELKQIVFDKTGTLTHQTFQVVEVWSSDGDPQRLLEQAAAVETRSEHPIGRALVSAVDVLSASVNDFCVHPSQGVSAYLYGKRMLIGNLVLMQNHNIVLTSSVQKRVEYWEALGSTVIYVARDEILYGLIAVDECPRPEIDDVIGQLKERHIDLTILTGDTTEAANRWQRRLEIPVLGNLSPQDKIDHIQVQTGPLAMVGDGINDGPALAAASVGISLSDGTDLAKAAADVILLNDDLRTLPWLLDLSAETMRCVRQNLAWALIYNVIGLGLAATGHLWPVISALAMVLSSAIVTTNATRLRHYQVQN